MSSLEWSRYMHDVIGLREPPEEINREVVERMLARYHERPAADRGRTSKRWSGWPRAGPLGLASSSNRALIDPCSSCRAWRRCSR